MCRNESSLRCVSSAASVTSILLLMVAGGCGKTVDAFSITSNSQFTNYRSSCSPFMARTRVSSNSYRCRDSMTAVVSTVSRHEMMILKGSSKDQHGDDEHDIHKKQVEGEEPPQLITREMLLRDMLSVPEDEDQIHDDKDSDEDHPSSTSTSATGTSASASAKVKRKKKNGSSSQYRVLDNRDSLPFLVRVATPDPYTSNEQMKKEAKLNTERAKKKFKKNGGGAAAAAGVGKMRQNLVGLDGKDSISSSIYARADDGSMHKIIGEFALDKSTNCGDIIEVGDGTQYQVQKARCQYKYVGGKRFVMTRKILEVKEIKRILIEKEVQTLFEKELSDVNEEHGRLGGEDGLFLE